MAPAAAIRARILSVMSSGKATIRAPRIAPMRGAEIAKSAEVNPLKALNKSVSTVPKGAKNPNGTSF